MDEPTGPDERCLAVRESLSAALDAEPEPVDEAERALHLEECAACRTWLEQAHDLTRRVRLAPVREVPDRVDVVVDAVLADRASRAEHTDRVIEAAPARAGQLLMRAALAVVAAAQLAIVVAPALLFADAGNGVPPHASRELGAFELALAVGFALAALYPRLSRGALVVCAPAVAVLVVVSILDTALAQTTVVQELPHLVALIGAALLALLAWRRTRDHPKARPADMPTRTA